DQANRAAHTGARSLTHPATTAVAIPRAGWIPAATAATTAAATVGVSTRTGLRVANLTDGRPAHNSPAATACAGSRPCCQPSTAVPAAARTAQVHVTAVHAWIDVRHRAGTAQ